MSFSLEDIADELVAATSKGREWFDAEGYGFRRLGRVDNSDIAKLAEGLRKKRYWQRVRRDPVLSARWRAYFAAWARAWRRANQEKARAKEKRKYQRIKADKARYARFVARNVEATRKRRQRPEVRAHLNQLALKYYRQRVATPEGRAKVAEYQRRAHQRRKARPEVVAAKREYQRRYYQRKREGRA